MNRVVYDSVDQAPKKLFEEDGAIPSTEGGTSVQEQEEKERKGAENPLHDGVAGIFASQNECDND